MARRNHAVEDSDSLTSLGSSSASASSDEAVQVARYATTPATSVFGDESVTTTVTKKSQARVVSRESISRAVTTRSRKETPQKRMSITQSKPLDNEDSDSELSDVDHAEEGEEEVGGEHASKRSRISENGHTKAVAPVRKGSFDAVSRRTSKADSGRSASGTTPILGKGRGNSPEVVVYVKRSSSEVATSASSSSSSVISSTKRKTNGSTNHLELSNLSRKGKRTRSSLATSSPIYREDSDMEVDEKDVKAEDSDPEATEDEILPVRKARTNGRRSKAKVESEDEDFMPSGGSVKAGSDAEEVEEEESESESEITTASKLLAKQLANWDDTKAASSPLKAKDKRKGKGKGKGRGKAKSQASDEDEDEELENLPPRRNKKITSKTVSKIARRSLEKLKRDIVNGSGKDKKGKLKKLESSDEDGDSDFVVKSSDESSAESAVETAADEQSSDLTDLEDGVTAVKAAAKRARAVAAKQRKGRNYGADGKKLTWWQKNDLALQKHHPELRVVWDDLRLIEVVKPIKADQPTGLTMKLLPFQLEGLYWMKEQEAGPWRGGLLADEMGMGKTIQMISLVLSDFKWNEKERTHTLVLAPTVAIMQWRNEFGKFTSGMKVCVWHGGNRTTDRKELLKYDVILTSYAVLESSFRRQNTGYKRKGELIKEESVLHSIDWHRVILDEAHNIKDRSCNTARGAFALKANYRWCLSGTPLQNRVGELYSLIRFIGVDPFAYYYCKKCPCKALHWRFSNKRTCDECGHTPMHHICYWNNEILKPIQKYGAMAGTHGAGAFEKLSLLLARMMLRRTKVDRADDMGLPPRDIVLRADFFTEEEEEFYTSLYSDVKRQFSTYVAADSLLNNYANVFQLLTRMRQTACHPDMVLKGAAAKALLGDGASKTAMSISTCRLCLDEGEDPIMSRCRHVFCRECIRQYLETAIEMEPECPVCHLPITIDLSQDTDEELVNARQGMLSKIDPGKWRTSTKIEALVEELSKLKTEDHSIKSLVFSQFTSFLDLIARRLQLAGFKVARLQGNMTPEARDRTVKYFMNTTDCTVFLLSLKAGGVALNLTEASRVFIMDPWWNPAAELQAMDRIHRIGQHRPVIVKRLIIENSIESKIVELQKKKENMTGAALGDDDQALGRLTPEDLSFLFVM